MSITKRWLALMLTVSVALSDCGGITVFATEDAIEVEMSDSKNSEDENNEEADSVQDEVTASKTDTDIETDTEMQLPALHIGQIQKGEKLPEPDDYEFVYDLPVSFEMSESIILFANYNLYTIPENDEKGTIVWSILRGVDGMEEGSASLVNEEDDWTGFEVVSDSPYFTMTENEDEKSDYYQTVEIAARNFLTNAVNEAGATNGNDEANADNEDYNYYIRAAYYYGTDEDKALGFYAAATVPFLLWKGADIDETQDDELDTEDIYADKIQGNDSVTEENGKAEIQGYESSEEENDIDVMPEDADVLNNETDETKEYASELSGNDGIQQASEQHISGLTLDRKSVELYIGESIKINATVVPEDIPVEIVWKSSDINVATVNENGEITAKAEGFAQITAKCDDLTASVKVEVVQKNAGKTVDISGDIWVAGFKRESEDFVYTGQKITQNIRVYHKDNPTPLKEKTDYTLSYKNNINAAAYNSAKAPSLTITFKGQYSGSVTLYYTIAPVDINDINIYKDSTNENNTSGYEQAVTYSKKLKIPDPELIFGKKKLTANKDFVCDYSTLPKDYKNGDSYEAGKVYDYNVSGIGNYTGSFQMHLVIVKDKSFNFNSASVTLGKKQYDYHGTALSKTEVTIEKMQLNKKTIESSLYDYEVYAEEIEGAYIMVYPTDAGRDAGYYGYKKVNLKLIGDRNIGSAALGEKWKESMTFSQTTVNEEGGIFQAKTGVLTFGTGTEMETLTEGEDYTVKYSNAQKVGNVTVTFTGKGRYKGTLKKKYEIKPNSDNDNLRIFWKNVTNEQDGTLVIAYQKGGAVPDFELKDQDDNVLKNKTDYTVKLVNNKNPGTVMSCEINGKGNYKGYTKTAQINVKNGDISLGIMSISDKPYSIKADAWKSKVTIKDVNGKTLAAGKDYDKEPTYKYENMEGVQYPEAGTTVNVTVNGMGAYEGSAITGSYRIYKNSISQLKITIDAKEYTGEEIKLSKEDIHVYATSADAKKKNELTESCYVIDGYANNIKTGTAKVILRGIGDYGGTKACSFKIKKKTYLLNRIKGITLNKTSLSISIQEKGIEERTLTVEIIPENIREDISNPTIIWSTSNSKIATVETGTANGNISTGIITPIKEGSVTITATTQEGKKKAQCKVNIVNAPILIEADKTIEGQAGDTYQLKFETDESVEVNLNGIEFESSNSEAVSVDAKGLITMKKTGAAIIKVYAAKRAYVQQCYVVVKGEENVPEKFHTFYKTTGSLDDTTDIRNAIYKANQTKTNGAYLYEGVYIPAGVYWIDATANANYGIFLDGREGTWNPLEEREKFEIRMSPGALLITKGNGSENYHVISISGCNNITISGGTIVGERNEHTSTGGEWGHGIGVYDCTNVSISDMDISQCWGDGIYLGSENDQKSDTATSSNIKITNCNVHDNRRSNLSITAADYVTIDKCKFNYAKGTDPQYGIDIETNNKNNPCEHIIISNTEMIGNAKASMGIITVANDIRLDNCTLSGAFYNRAGTNIVLHNTTIKGEIVDQTGGIRRE